MLSFLLVFVEFSPTFAVVREIYCVHSKPLLKVSACINHGLDSHYRSYLISETSEEVLYNIFDLPDYSIMHVHQSFSQTNQSSYICLKWNVENSE